MDPYIKNNNGRTILHSSINTCVIKYLIEEVKMDPYIKDNDGMTLLHLSCVIYTVSDLWIDAIETVSDLCEDQVFIRDRVFIKYLIDEIKMNPNVQTNKGVTVLHIAVKHNIYGLVDLLLTLPNIDINLVDNDGMTALHYASCKHRMINKLSRYNNINPNVMDKHGRTPLYYAIKYACDIFVGDVFIGDTSNICELLKIPGINKNIKDNDWPMPIYYDQQSLEQIKLLLIDNT